MPYRGYPDVDISVELADGTVVNSHNYVWNTVTLAWEKATGGDPVGANVNVANFPAVYPVNDNGGSLTVDGSVSVSNFPAVQSIDDNGGSLTVDTAQLPATLTGSGNLKTAIAESITLTIADGGGSITVDGTVTANAGTGSFTVNDGGLSLTVDDGGTPLNVAQSGTWNINNISGTISLPTGAATEVTLGTRLADATFTGRINTQGQKPMATSTPVVLASDQTVIPISDNGSSLTVDDGGSSLTVDGTVTSNIGTTGGLALDATLTGGSAKDIIRGGTKGTTVPADITSSSIDANHNGVDISDGGGSISIDDNGGSITVDGTVAATQSGSWTVTANAGTNLNTSLLALESGGNLATLAGGVTASVYQENLKQVNGVSVNVGTGTAGTGTQRVAVASDSSINAVQSGTWTVQPGNTVNTTPWLVSSISDKVASAPTSVAVGTSSASAVASNASRKGLILRNVSGGSKRVSLGLDGNAAVLNNGITLDDGDSYYMSEYDFTTGAVAAICSSSGGSLAIQEYT